MSVEDVSEYHKSGVLSAYNRFGRRVAQKFYSIPTSKIAYEFTRKVYKLLELDVNAVEAKYTSYDLINDAKLTQDQSLHINSKRLKFDVIVGNPPYQITQQKTSDIPIYNVFMEVAYYLSEKVILITPGRFLFNAGKTPKDWNKKMLHDEHLRVTSYFSNSSEVFPGIDIMGGVAVTLRDTKQTFEKIGVFSKFQALNSILQKVIHRSDFVSFDCIIFHQNKFDLAKLYEDYPSYKNIIGSNGREKRLTTSIFQQLSVFSIQPTSNDDVCILGLVNNTRTYRYIPAKYLEESENINSFKVLLPKSNGSGAVGETIPTVLIGEPVIGMPGSGCTQSFISIGCFDSHASAEACLKYIKTKFVRIMLGVLKVTQDNNKDVWKFVPLEDFSAESDIDWGSSIAEDRQLYKKYGLTAEEVAFIESMIKPMNSENI